MQDGPVVVLTRRIIVINKSIKGCLERQTFIKNKDGDCVKKIIGIILLVQSVLITIVGIQIYKNVCYSNLLYENNTAIVVRDKLGGGKMVSFFRDKAKKDNITISKYSHVDEDNLIVYTNDLSLDGKISLKNIDNIGADTFVANYKSNDKKQVGQFRLFGTEQKITIRSLEQIRNSGIDGLYYVKDEYAEQIVQEINSSVGYAELYNEYSMELSTYLDDCIELIAGIGMTILILIVSIMHYMIKRSKKIAILKIQGLSAGNIIKNIFSELITTQFMILILGIVGAAVFSIIEYGVSSIADVLVIYLLSYIFSNVFYYMVALFVLLNVIFWGKTVPMLNGKKPYKIIMVVHVTLKAMFLTFLLVATLQLFDQMKALKIEQDNLQIWKKAQNVYSTALNYVGESRESEERLVEFYKLLEAQGGFLIDADNFDLVDDENHLYDVNAPGEESYYDPNGRTIVVNENYLRLNSILSDQEEIWDKIVYEDNVRNILVPVNLKKYEEEIYQRFLKNFYFQKVEVENIYNENLGKPLNNLPIEELSINIIYIDQGQEYFPYADIEIENGCKITNPIVVLETGNIDDSYYRSYLTRCMFFKHDGIGAYDSLIPIIKQTKTFSEVQNVVSVYESHGEKIYSMEMRRNYLLTAICAIVIMFFISGYLVISSYFQENNYKIYIKKIFGFNLYQRIYRFIWIVFLIDVGVLCCVAVSQGAIVAVVLGGLIILLDMVMLFIESNRLDQKSFNTIIKGEH